MSGGLTRREIIRRSAVAGAVAWTAPLILTSNAAALTTTVCLGVKIPSAGAINKGTVAQCPNFETPGLPNTADLSGCVTRPSTPGYSPSTGFVVLLCGPLTTNVTGIAVKVAADEKCDPWGGSGCVAIYDTPFPDVENKQLMPYSNCDGGSPDGFTVKLSQTGQAFTTLPESALGAPPGNCRWLVADAPPNVNNIGVQACFEQGSIPPNCN
jgi:hypothetical protein